MSDQPANAPEPPLNQKPPPIRLLSLAGLLDWLRRVWDWEPGERKAKNRCLAVVAAGFGLFVILAVGVLWGFATQGLYSLTEEFLEAATAGGWRLMGIAETLVVTIFVLTIVAGSSFLVGLAIYSSSSRRSYLCYAWRGILVVPSSASYSLW